MTFVFFCVDVSLKHTVLIAVALWLSYKIKSSSCDF